MQEGLVFLSSVRYTVERATVTYFKHFTFKKNNNPTMYGHNSKNKVQKGNTI